MGKQCFFGRYLGVLILSLNILMVLGCQSPEEEAKDHLKKGKELLIKGDFAAAKLEFKNAEQTGRGISETYYNMALLDEKTGNVKSMRENLKKALEIDPENIEARVALGKVLLLFNDVDGALLQAGRALSQDNINPGALLLKASALIRQSKHVEALSIIDGVLIVDSENTEALSLKVMILMENEDFDEVSILINKAIQEKPDNFSLLFLKIRLDTKQGDTDALISDYEKLLQLYPGNLELSYVLAGIYTRAKRTVDAEKMLFNLVAENPDNLNTKLVLLTYMKTQGETRTQDQLLEYIGHYKEQPEVLIELSNWMMKSGKFYDAESVLLQIVKQQPKPKLNASVRILWAELALQSKDLDSSLNIANKVLKERPEYLAAILLKARVMLMQREMDKAIALLKSVLFMNPDSDEALVMLAQAYLIKGDTVMAKKSFRQAFKINPGNLHAAAAEFNRAMKKKNLKNAKNILEYALIAQPANVDLMYYLGLIRVTEQDWEDAWERVNNIEGQQHNKLLGYFLRGKIYQEQGSYLEAIKIYKELLKSMPNNDEALKAMASCYEALNKRQNMLGYLSIFIKDNPQIISAYILKSRLFQLENKSSDAITVIKQAISIDDINVESYTQLAIIYLAMGNQSEALAAYKRGLSRNPDSVKLSLLLASFHERNGGFEEAVSIYEHLIEKNPRLYIAVSNLASILTDHYGDEESLKRAKLLTMRFENSEQPFFSDSYAWNELKLGNVKEVLKIFENNVLLVPDLPVFKFHLGVAYHQMGNNGAAMAELQQAINLSETQEFVEIASARQLLKEIKESR